ncbi:CobW family GTP-binding protein [Pseudomonas petrae]|uniref:CobW family GTP-binding protein n=1 Tax=Pseudomonas petrae TaxID=2912190 RepID=A0ABS9I0I9_9PSED|nr:CobW family GTP-binding protein [Pseudomonas petrae]MCF7537181.1 CobW family GTP-binding protein [Pseudomonas petrae]MCF7540857.1 CobW family GTP-binding protein [Pseudomonas petrae]MCF7556359.1 CobW family GTP-binding protein [Pseudomonas petrae]
MLQNIPTHVIAGPLGAGKTSLIRHLLKQKPAGERWAVLINEFGQIGLDAALLTTGDDGIALGEVAGGCLCCVNGAPFQIGLGRLLRKARPDRLLIEPSGLGHPVQLIRQLHEAPWIGVLAIQPSVMVLDAQTLAQGKELPDTQRNALPQAGLLVLNKSEGLDSATRKAIADALPARLLRWTDHGVLSLDSLPGIDVSAHAGSDNPAVPRSLAQLPPAWVDPMTPVCLSQQQAEGWSIGWRWHPERVFDAAKVQIWLQTLSWRRAKLVIHSEKGWVSGNALNGSTLEWASSEWRKDSRLELIFEGPQDEAALQTALAGCLL